jgi:hypothetical protein
MSAQLTHQPLHAGTSTSTSMPVTATGHRRLHAAWHRIRLAISEMNYASRRIVEVQAPWTAGK